MSAQTATVAAVARRGYLPDGYDPQEMTAKQLVKMLEELAEALECTSGGSVLYRRLVRQVVAIGSFARLVFDDPASFVGVTVDDNLMSETADMAVVLAMLAHVQGIPDIMYAAQVKAERDAERGVRNGK